MPTAKQFFLVAGLFITLCSKASAQEPDSLEITLSLKDQSVVPLPKQRRPCYAWGYSFINKSNRRWNVISHVDVIITNRSRKPKTIELWTCSHWMNFVSNSDHYPLLPWGCDSNFPDRFEILPDSSIQRTQIVQQLSYTDLETLESTSGAETKLRIGLVIPIDTAEGQHTSIWNLENDKSLGRIIWSKPLDIFRPRL